MEKLVSVVVPTYGRSTTLKRALESIDKQTYDNIEIIVVDDNGLNSENSKAVKQIVEDCKHIKKGIRLINNEHNVGGAEARNIGLYAAKGDYIAFLDDDDEIFEDKVNLQANVLNKEDVALVYCYSKTVFDDEKNKTVIYDKNDFVGNCLKELIIDGTIAATSQWLCKKQDLLEIGGFDNVPSKQDSTLIMKLLEAGKKIDRVPEILSIYHVQQNNSISTSEKSKDGLIIYWNKCRKHYDLLSKDEIKKVEYNFAEQMYLKNYKNKKNKQNKQNKQKYFKVMLSNRFWYACYRKIYYYLFFVKHNMKN